LGLSHLDLFLITHLALLVCVRVFLFSFRFSFLFLFSFFFFFVLPLPDRYDAVDSPGVDDSSVHDESAFIQLNDFFTQEADVNIILLVRQNQ
jgi:hypothetical protein